MTARDLLSLAASLEADDRAMTSGPWERTRLPGFPHALTALYRVEDASGHQVADCYDNRVCSDEQAERDAYAIARTRNALPSVVTALREAAGRIAEYADTIATGARNLGLVTMERDQARARVEELEGVVDAYRRYGAGHDKAALIRIAELEAESVRATSESERDRRRVEELEQHVANLVNTVGQHERNRESIKAIRAERDQARARVEELEAALACEGGCARFNWKRFRQAEADVERMRGVFEAAVEWRERIRERPLAKADIIGLADALVSAIDTLAKGANQ